MFCERTGHPRRFDSGWSDVQTYLELLLCHFSKHFFTTVKKYQQLADLFPGCLQSQFYCTFYGNALVSVIL